MHYAAHRSAGARLTRLQRLAITGMVLLQADEELLKLSLDDLPGVGYTMAGKLRNLGLTSVADVRNSRKDMLQQELGAKSGSMVILNAALTHAPSADMHHASSYSHHEVHLMHRVACAAGRRFLLRLCVYELPA